MSAESPHWRPTIENHSESRFFKDFSSLSKEYQILTPATIHSEAQNTFNPTVSYVSTQPCSVEEFQHQRLYHTDNRTQRNTAEDPVNPTKSNQENQDVLQQERKTSHTRKTRKFIRTLLKILEHNVPLSYPPKYRSFVHSHLQKIIPFRLISTKISRRISRRFPQVVGGGGGGGCHKDYFSVVFRIQSLRNSNYCTVPAQHPIANF